MKLVARQTTLITPFGVLPREISMRVCVFGKWLWWQQSLFWVISTLERVELTLSLNSEIPIIFIAAELKHVNQKCFCFPLCLVIWQEGAKKTQLAWGDAQKVQAFLSSTCSAFNSCYPLDDWLNFPQSLLSISFRILLLLVRWVDTSQV